MNNVSQLTHSKRYTLIGGRIDYQAQDHFNRVIADGGTIPAGLVGCDAWFKAVKGVYGVSDITAAISCAYDPHYLGYKLGAGSGATLGSAAQTCYNAIGAIGDLVQTTAASQPLILPHTGTNYVYLPRVASNNFTTPSATANRISGDIDIIVNCRSLTSSTVQTLLLKGNGTSYNYAFDISSTNTLRLIYGGFTISESTATITPTSLKWYRVTRNSSTGDVIFYTGDNGTTWVQLGSTRTTTAGSLPLTTDSVVIGDNTAFPGNGFLGVINRATISNTIGGNPVVDFNPASYSASTSQTQWTSSTGEVWTINRGTTTTGYKVAIVDRSILMSDGVDDKLISSSLSFTAPTYMQVVTRVFPTSPGTTEICGGNNLNYYTQDGGLRRSVKDGNVQGDASGYTARILCLEGLQISRTANQFIFSRNDSTTLTTSIGGAPITDSSVISMFSNLAGNLPSNCSVNSLVFSTYPSTAQRTSFYNVLKAFNNNAF